MSNVYKPVINKHSVIRQATNFHSNKTFLNITPINSYSYGLIHIPKPELNWLKTQCTNQAYKHSDQNNARWSCTLWGCVTVIHQFCLAAFRFCATQNNCKLIKRANSHNNNQRHHRHRCREHRIAQSFCIALRDEILFACSFRTPVVIEWNHTVV